MTIDTYFYPLLSFIPALLNLGIIGYLFLFLPRGKTTDIFAFFVIALLLWQVQDTIVRLCEYEETARFWDAILCIGWQGFAPFAVHFACRYAHLKFIQKRFALVAIYLPFLIFYILYKAQDVKPHFDFQQGWGWVVAPRPGTLDGFHRYLVSVYIIAAVIVLFKYAFSLEKNTREKGQAFLIAFGMLAPMVQGIVTQVVFPLLLDKPEIPLTSTFLTFFSVATIISIGKYGLFNLSESVEVESVFASLKNMVVVVSPDRKVLYLNPYSKEVFGIKENEMQGTLLSRLFMAEEHYQTFSREVLEPALAGHSVKNVASTLFTPEGKKMEVLISAEAVVNNRKIQAVLLVANDITERLKTLEELKESNERYNLISKATNDMVWDWNLVTGEVFRNREGWRKLFGEPLQNEKGSEEDWNARLHPEDLPLLQKVKNQFLASEDKEFFEIECRIIKADGSLAYILDRGYIVRAADGKPLRILGATQDITRRKESEQRLREEQARRHREITRATIAAQENVQQHIGAELHDNVNQILASSILYLGLARTDASPMVFVEKSQDLVRSAIDEIRKLSHSLISPSLNDETLIGALKGQVERVQHTTNLSFQTNFEKFDETKLSEELKLAIYRICQEQLNNIIKYARARKIILELIDDQDGITLRIKDDGVGFNPSQKTKGVGLMNIKTRAALHNGRVNILTAPDSGCCIEIKFPQVAREEALLN